MTDLDAPGRVDGRTARAERTRKAIVDAHLSLLDEGDLKPTGERIAERAGVSLRALWTNFRDMETLFAAVSERLMERQDAEFRPVEPELPLPRRVEEFCRQRARMLEIIAPSARAAQLREPFSAALRRSRARYITRTRDEIETLFAQELDMAGSGRKQLLDAVTVASTFAAWSMLRDELGLGVDEACGVMQRTVTALLAAALAASFS
jgi:TetR/AcrR family transcriptional regulator, regulator of autoinduction and epiphytic fitness